MGARKASRQASSLQHLAVDACSALARLEVVRLEELLACGQELYRDREQAEGYERARLAREAEEARAAMAALARTLAATRQNLDILRRLEERRREPLEYSETEANGYGDGLATASPDGSHGNN